MKKISDKKLVARLKAEDETVFPILMKRYKNMVYQLAFKLTKHKNDAEDVVQDVFLTILEKIHTFREEAALSSWIYRVTVNAALMKLRKRQKKGWESLDSDLPKFLEDGHYANPTIDWKEHPDAIALNQEAMEMISRAVSQLPEKYRMPFILQNMEGYSLREIGEMLDLTIPTVKIRLHRARLFLREQLSGYYTPVSAMRADQSVATRN